MSEQLFSNELLRQILISAVVVWGFVEVVKPVLRTTIPANWKRFIIRLLSMALGFGSGWLIGGNVVHAMAGSAGGALSAVLVAVFKAFVKKRLGVEVPDVVAEEETTDAE